VLHDTSKYTWQVHLLHHTDVPSNFIAPLWFWGIERHFEALKGCCLYCLCCLLIGGCLLCQRVECSREWSGHVTSAYVLCERVECACHVSYVPHCVSTRMSRVTHTHVMCHTLCLHTHVMCHTHACHVSHTRMSCVICHTLCADESAVHMRVCHVSESAVHR